MLRGVRRNRWVPALLLLALALMPALGQPYLTRFATEILIFGIVAISLDLIVGYGGMVSFGHAAFFGVGAYAAGVLGFYGIHSSLLAVPAAILVSALAALLIGGISLRTSGVYFIMITLAFAQMIYYLATALVIYGGNDGLKMQRNRFADLPVGEPHVFFYLVLVVFLAVFFGARRMVESRFGRVLRGIRDNEPRMQSLGYDTYRYRLAAFTIAGATAGLGGLLDANLNRYVSPDLLHWGMSGDLLVMLVLGGAGTLTGPVIGAAVFLFLEEILSAYTKHWMLVLGPVLLVVVIFSSGGLYALLQPRPRHD
ncbi:MAG: branched-chain amino acid ABC transporter permease [Stellaceae bacterium]